MAMNTVYIPRMLLVSLCGLSLAGCISTPQTKALITPVGVVGIHSFAPPHQTPTNVDFEQRLAQRTRAQAAEQQSSNPQTRS